MKEEEESIRIRNRVAQRREAQQRAAQSCIGYHRAIRSCTGLQGAENRAAQGRKRSRAVKEEEESIRIRNRVAQRREAQQRAAQSCIG